MALTKDQAALKVIARLIEKGEKADSLLKPDIISWIDEALQRVARIVADSPQWQELTTSTTFSVAFGIGTIPSSTFLLDTIPKTGRLYDNSSGIPYKFVPRPEALRFSFSSTDVGHWAFDGAPGGIRIKDETGNLTATKTLAIVGSAAAPTLGTSTSTDLPVKFENLLIDVLVSMAAEKQSRKPFPLIQTGDSK
jgi:hypothetical protein